MQKLILKKNIYLITFIISLLSIFGAIYIEYVLGVKPCVLCLYQRVPYLISIFICFLGYYNNKSFFLIYCLLFIFLISITLSGYHLGIENNIFKEFSGCSNENINLTDKEELLKSLEFSRPNCKDVSFKLLGLSLAAINLIISIFISVLILILFKNEKNR